VGHGEIGLARSGGGRRHEGDLAIAQDLGFSG
jgi:hypothetical protein